MQKGERFLSGITGFFCVAAGEMRNRPNISWNTMITSLVPQSLSFVFRFAFSSEIGYYSGIVTNSASLVKDDIMERTEKALKLPAEQFKRNIGTTKPVFQQMMTVLQSAYETLHNDAGGKPPALTVGDKLLITLQYYRESRTMEQISIDYAPLNFYPPLIIWQ